MKNRYNKTIVNTIMLYLMSGAKIVFPLVTLPYLARVLTVDCYGLVSYVRTVVGYAQLLIDFGFILSSVKNIVETNGDNDRISYIIGDTVVSKLMLSFIAFVGAGMMSITLPILHGSFLFVMLSVMVPVLSSFLMDFLFRGIEKMHIVSGIYVFMKLISVVFTVLCVKNDNYILLIPIFDIISSVFAIVLSWKIVKRLGFSAKFSGIKKCFMMLKSSFGYFANSIASTAFGALNTLIIGALMNDTVQVAYWSVCMQLVGAIQTMYTPISNGVYPYMIRNKELKLIRTIVVIFLPVITFGSVICYFVAPTVLTIIAGEKYASATGVFRMLLPMVIMSFPAVILGWPALGAIDKVGETTKSTLFAAAVQMVGLIVLISMKKFSLINIAGIRVLSEAVLLIVRAMYVYKYRKQFQKVVD